MGDSFLISIFYYFDKFLQALLGAEDVIINPITPNGEFSYLCAYSKILPLRQTAVGTLGCDFSKGLAFGPNPRFFETDVTLSQQTHGFPGLSLNRFYNDSPEIIL